MGAGAVTDIDELVTWLRGILDQRTTWASEASRRADGAGYTAEGEQWQWVCDACDRPIVIDLVTVLDEVLECPTCEGGQVDLRSVQEYETRTVGMLPHFVLSLDSDAVSPVVAWHIQHGDPRQVLADVAATRAVLDSYEHQRASYIRIRGTLEFWEQAVRTAAIAYAHWAGYREEWRP